MSDGPRSPARRRKWLRRLPWVIPGVLLLGFGALQGGIWVYINWIKEPAPARLSFENRDAEAATASSVPVTAAIELTGTWTVSAPSTAGYRVKEILFGQDTEGVGRTDQVTGEVRIDGTTVGATELAVDLETVTSDESRRDEQFRDRLLNVAEFPVALFTLLEPIRLDEVPPVGTEITVAVSGELTLRGNTVPVTFDLQAKRTETEIQLVGTIPIVFADYEIPDPSIGPVQTEDNGVLEFAVTLTRAA